MRHFSLGLVVASLAAAVACGGGPPVAEVAPLPAAGSGAPAPTEGAAERVVEFEGSFDAASGDLTIVTRAHSSGVTIGATQIAATLPWGTGPNQMVMHTISTAWNATTHQLTAHVSAVSHFSLPVLNVTSVVDSISPSTVTSDGPWVYGGLLANATSLPKTWTFNDPTGASFTFKGHIEGDTPPCGRAGWRCVFLTSAAYTGDLGGLAGADAKCQSLADASGIRGTYRAWLSTGTANAKDRMTIESTFVPYIRMDGKPLASSGPALLTPPIANAISITELGGTRIDLGLAAFTYTLASGMSVQTDPVNGAALSAPGHDCNEWTDATHNFIGIGGGYTKTTAAWSLASFIPCQSTRPLYCFEQ